MARECVETCTSFEIPDLDCIIHGSGSASMSIPVVNNAVDWESASPKPQSSELTLLFVADQRMEAFTLDDIP